MELKVIPGNTIQDPNPAQIDDALQQVYAGTVTAVILNTNDEGRYFIQATGGRVEYKDDDSGVMYAVDGVPFEKCAEIFLDYLAQGSAWKESLPWAAFTINKKAQKQSGKMPSKFIPVHEEPKLKGGRLLLVVLLSVICTLVGFCLFINYTQGVEPIQQGRLFGEIFINVVWFSLAGIGWAIFRTRKLWNKSFINVFMGVLILLAAGELWLSSYALGVLSFSFFTALILGVLSLWTLIKGLRLVLEFESDSVETAADHLSFVRKTAAGEYGPSEYTALAYVFLDQYTGSIDLSLKQEKSYKAASAEKRLHLLVHYLPRDPKIHRMRVEIKDNE